MGNLSQMDGRDQLSMYCLELLLLTVSSMPSVWEHVGNMVRNYEMNSYVDSTKRGANTTRVAMFSLLISL